METAILITHALTGLIKQIKAVRYYPPRHPALQAAARQSLKGIAPLLEDSRHFSLTIRKEAFLFDGQPVAKSQQLLAQFATFCFARRVQYLTLLPELRAEELNQFIQFLVMDPQEIQRLGGLQSLLERAHLTNIWINEQDLDTILEKKQKIEAQPAPDEAKIASMLAQEMPPQPEADARNLKTVLKKLQQERDDQKFWQLLQELIPLLRLNLTEENRSLVLQAFVMICGFASGKSTSDARQEHAQNALRQLATDEVIDYLAISLLAAQGKEKTRTALIRVLAYLGEKAAGRIMDLLTRENSAGKRKLLASVLVLSGDVAVPTLQEHLFDHRWYVVRNAVAILGEIRQQESLVHLTPLLQHNDIRVRRETIRSLTKIGGPRAVNILLQTTRSNDQELRRQALLSLGAIRAASAVPTLIKIVKKSGLSRDKIDLRRDAIRSLGEIRSADAVPLLEQILAKRMLFRRLRFDELRVAAASALGEIGEDSSRAILEKATHDPSASVARAANQALKHIDKGIS